jgi:hypothetical protein
MMTMKVEGMVEGGEMNMVDVELDSDSHMVQYLALEVF